MPNPKWGTKRTCPSCGAHFYDLQKNPATCPKCAHAFDPTAVAKIKRGRGKKTEVAGLEDNEDILLKRKKSLEVEDDAELEIESFGGDIEEIDDIDDLQGIEEEIEGIEVEEAVNTEDDGDDEAMIEDLDAGEERLIDDVDDEEEEDK